MSQSLSLDYVATDGRFAMLRAGTESVIATDRANVFLQLADLCSRALDAPCHDVSVPLFADSGAVRVTLAADGTILLARAPRGVSLDRGPVDARAVGTWARDDALDLARDLVRSYGAELPAWSLMQWRLLARGDETPFAFRLAQSSAIGAAAALATKVEGERPGMMATVSKVLATDWDALAKQMYKEMMDE